MKKSLLPLLINPFPFRQKSNNRFELADKFIKDSKQAKIIASKENPEGIRDFLKKIGSNFQIQNQNISFSPRGAWQILSKWDFGARSAPVEAQRAEAISPQNVKIVNWRCILEIARTEFCPRRALRGSELAGGQNERRSREH